MAFNGRFVLNMIHFAVRSGSNLSDLIELSGKTADELSQETCIVADADYNAVIEFAVDSTGDDCFGLHAGESLNMSAAGLIGQLTQSAATIKQALDLCCEYANLGCSALPMSLIEGPEEYKVTLTPNELWKTQSELAVNHTADGVMAFSIKEFHSLTRSKFFPIAIHLTKKKPENFREYERVFNCPVLYNQKELAILLKKEHVEERVITSDYNLLRILVAHANEKSAKLKGDIRFQAIVKESVINLIKPEFPTIEQVAGHLNISPRTLQRKLHEEGQSFKSIIDELRMEFAKSYLKRSDLSLAEVGYLLGYSDPSAFNRAFKRWFNTTPSNYRGEHQ